MDGSFADNRLRLARSYADAARNEAALIEPGDIANPAMSQTVLAAIACADARCARHGGYVNQQDHAAAVQVLRDALGNRLPGSQATRLSRILAEKDAVQHGVRLKSRDDAAQLLGLLEDFTAWAERELARTP